MRYIRGRIIVNHKITQGEFLYRCTRISLFILDRPQKRDITSVSENLFFLFYSFFFFRDNIIILTIIIL